MHTLQIIGRNDKGTGINYVKAANAHRKNPKEVHHFANSSRRH